VGSVKTGKFAVWTSDLTLYTSHSAAGQSCETKPIWHRARRGLTAFYETGYERQCRLGVGEKTKPIWAAGRPAMPWVPGHPPPAQEQALAGRHGRDARDTHGRDAHATERLCAKQSQFVAERWQGQVLYGQRVIVDLAHPWSRQNKANFWQGQARRGLRDTERGVVQTNPIPLGPGRAGLEGRGRIVQNKANSRRGRVG
jgi:hypothetical protein